eukprot:1141726-Pelagomonas_calceolata.AAC.2
MVGRHTGGLELWLQCLSIETGGRAHREVAPTRGRAVHGIARFPLPGSSSPPCYSGYALGRQASSTSRALCWGSWCPWQLSAAAWASMGQGQADTHPYLHPGGWQLS